MLSGVCIPTQERGNEMLHESDDERKRRVAGRYVGNGEWGMHSHAGAWERDAMIRVSV